MPHATEINLTSHIFIEEGEKVIKHWSGKTGVWTPAIITTADHLWPKALRLSQGVINNHAPAACHWAGPPAVSGQGLFIKGKCEEHSKERWRPIRSFYKHPTSCECFLSLSSDTISACRHLLPSAEPVCFLLDGKGLSHSMLLYFCAAAAEADDHVTCFINIKDSHSEEAEMHCYALADMKLWHFQPF